MRKLAFVLAISAAVSVSACKSTQDALFTGIPADKIAPVVDAAAAAGGVTAPGVPGVGVPGVNVPGVGVPGVGIPGVPALPTLSPEMLLAAEAIRASGVNPVCGQFNMNSLAALSRPGGGSIPGLGILKIIAVGAISGVTGGAVSELGIGSRFVETAVAGTVNQVAYNVSKPVVDGLLPSGQEADTVSDIYDAADRVDCPHPKWAEDLSPKDARTLLAVLTAEFAPK